MSPMWKTALDDGYVREVIETCRALNFTTVNNNCEWHVPEIEERARLRDNKTRD